MTFSARSAAVVVAPGFRALDVLSRQGREDMLDLIWAAWFASRPERTRETLFAALSGDPEALSRAAMATAEATRTLMRLRSAAAGDAEVAAIVDGLLEGELVLLEGGLVLHVPPRLRRVLAAGDGDRSRALARVRAEAAVRLPRGSAETISAVLGYLVGTELDPDGTRVREVPEARGFGRAAMSSLGLPFDAYMGRMRGWL